ncbi:hypothetical protein MNBD_GAMMA09-2069 [hydrothermal vent metagenome]|uniref:Solute-binding protein family 3/N-terminal domain-containing protein n=1 Tax=hydrothermal vent metagenome TaxID=652676 RepID=A0A3B0XZC1_9ZZZZ
MDISKNLIACLGTLLVSITHISISSADINLGVLAPRGELKAKKRWNDFASYLTEKTDQKVNMIALSPRNVIDAVENSQVDILLINPVLTAKIEKLHGANLLATLNKNSGSVFAGVIVAKKGSGIKTAEDLKNKKVMSLKFRVAAGAYTFQAYHLYKQGINPHKDFASMRASKKQDDLVLAVKAGMIDAAFVRSGILESMQKEGKIKISDFVVIDQHASDELKPVHTTQHYPEWYLFSLNSVDSSIAEKIKAAALAIKADDAVAKKAKIKGFVEPISLDGMKSALTALKISPFSN